MGEGRRPTQAHEELERLIGLKECLALPSLTKATGALYVQPSGWQGALMGAGNGDQAEPLKLQMLLLGDHPAPLGPAPPGFGEVRCKPALHRLNLWWMALSPQDLMR